MQQTIAYHCLQLSVTIIIKAEDSLSIHKEDLASNNLSSGTLEVMLEN